MVVTFLFFVLIVQDEEQWKDFEAPQELDVSGLRVQSLQKRYVLCKSIQSTFLVKN